MMASKTFEYDLIRIILFGGGNGRPCLQKALGMIGLLP
jgi:hypothetical protein